MNTYFADLSVLIEFFFLEEPFANDFVKLFNTVQ